MKLPNALFRPAAALFFLLFVVAPPVLGQKLAIEYFGAERSYSAAEERVVLLGLVRNVGETPTPANLFRLRCYPLSGLDYTFGETMPALPSLKPGEAAACRWTLSTRPGRTPYTAAVILETADRSRAAPPQTKIGVIPRLDKSQPLILTAPSGGVPLSLPPVHPDRVQLQLLQDADGYAALTFAAREGEGWTAASTLFPLLQVKGSDPGQSGWEEGFRALEAKVTRTSASVLLSLLGSVGARWTAEIELELKRDTAAVEGKIRLIARRDVLLEAISLPALLTPFHAGNSRADGVPQPVPLFPLNTGASGLLAGETAGALTGIAVSPASPISGFTLDMKQTGFLNPILTIQWRSPLGGTRISAGTKLILPFRFFSLSLASGIHDARRFALP